MTDITGWYNNSQYSDLTLKLSDGRKIKVHKLVLCTRNKYFASLCGSDSSFAVSDKRAISSLDLEPNLRLTKYLKEAKQIEIELKDDDPDAVEEVLQAIYGSEAPHVSDRSWRFWLTLIVTASKYIESELETTAQDNLREIAWDTDDMKMVMDIFMAIHEELNHLELMVTFAENLRKKTFSSCTRISAIAS